MIPTNVAWHSSKKILAIAWENGEITVWNDHEKEVHPATQLHSTSITAIAWTNNGSRLATCDKVIRFVSSVFFFVKDWANNLCVFDALHADIGLEVDLESLSILIFYYQQVLLLFLLAILPSSLFNSPFNLTYSICFIMSQDN